MKVVVSNELKDNYSGYKVVDSLLKVTALEGVTTLVIHTFVESDFDAGVWISKFYKAGVKEFVYINREPHAIVRMVIEGVNGHIFKDEFYFDDEEELTSLLTEIGVGTESTGLSIAGTSVQILRDFTQAFARGEERIKTTAYLQQVNNALDELNNITERQTKQISAMGISALDIFEKASTIIKNLNDTKTQIQDKLTELEESKSNAPTNAFTNNINFYQPYSYMGNATVLVIRELSPCKYLTSFVLGYLHHLHYDLNKRVKLVFVHQKGQGVSLKYADYTSITQESDGIRSLYDAEKIATNNPKKEVMRELLSKQMDVFIVVDRLYSNKEIVTGRTHRINAVSGKSDLERYTVKSEDCIFSVSAPEGTNPFFCIPTVKNYSSELDARHSAYVQVAGDAYKRLDTRVGVVPVE